jgi:hypothetical protein
VSRWFFAIFVEAQRNEKGKRRKEVGVVHNAVSYQLFGKFDFSWH